ncbi:MAG: hypothetical protein AAF653_16250, partial [Chloroflexota bacterium]
VDFQNTSQLKIKTQNKFTTRAGIHFVRTKDTAQAVMLSCQKRMSVLIDHTSYPAGVVICVILLTYVALVLGAKTLQLSAQKLCTVAQKLCKLTRVLPCL